MRRIIIFYLRNLTAVAKLHLAALAVGILIVAILEMLVVATLAGFTTLIATAGKSVGSTIPSALQEFVQPLLVNDFDHLASWIALAAVLSLLLKNLVQAVNTFFLNRLALQTEARFGRELLEAYSNAPFLTIKKRSQDDIAQNIRWRSYYGRNVLSSLLSLAAHGTVGLFLVFYLLTTMPDIASAVILVVSLLFILVNRLLQKPLVTLANRCLSEEREINRRTESFVRGLRQIRVSGGTQWFANGFDGIASKFAITFSLRQVALRGPSWLMETLGLAILVMAILILLRKEALETEAIAGIASLIVVSAWRLLKAVVEIQREFAKIKTAEPFVRKLIDELEELKLVREHPEENVSMVRSNKAIAIELNDVCFRYPGQSSNTLNHINLSVAGGEVLGVIGRSGQGKSTLTDLIMGLFLPTSGHLTIDDKEMSISIARQWQKQVGYLCQSPFLLKGTLLENIAFGEDPTLIDKTRALLCAKMAQVDFLGNRDDAEPLTCVVDAAQLSGGQSLRIAIARALYKTKSLLILDEPTSALDHASSQILRETLRSMKKELTQIVVSHDLELLSLCDRIVWLEDGEVKKVGPAKQIIEMFRNVVADEIIRSKLVSTQSLPSIRRAEDRPTKGS